MYKYNVQIKCIVKMDSKKALKQFKNLVNVMFVILKASLKLNKYQCKVARCKMTLLLAQKVVDAF